MLNRIKQYYILKDRKAINKWKGCKEKSDKEVASNSSF